MAPTFGWFRIGSPYVLTFANNLATFNRQSGAAGRPRLLINCRAGLVPVPQPFGASWNGSSWVLLPQTTFPVTRVADAMSASGHVALVETPSTPNGQPQLVAGTYSTSAFLPVITPRPVSQSSDVSDIISDGQGGVYLASVTKVGTDFGFKVEQIVPTSQQQVLGTTLLTPFVPLRRPKLLLDSQGALYLVIWTALSMPGAAWSGFRMVVFKWNGTAWPPLPNSFVYPRLSFQTVSNLDAQIAPDDTIVGAFCEPTPTYNAYFTPWRRTSTSWTHIPTPMPLQTTGGCRFTFDSASRLMIAYQEAGSNNIAYAKYDGGAWVGYPSVTVGGVADFAILNAAYDIPTVAWIDTVRAGYELEDYPLYVAEMRRLRRPRPFPPRSRGLGKTTKPKKRK